jgi:Uma2 family endonuclease
MSLAQPKLHTAEDLDELARNGKGYEIVRGILIEELPVGNYIAKLELKIASIILGFIEENDISGEVLPATARFRLKESPDTVRGPEISFICGERLPEGVSDRVQDLAPDLVVEIVSKSNPADEIETRIIDYLEAGTRLLWVIYPKSRSAYIYQSLDSVMRIDEEGVLDGGEVLPGFSLSLLKLFKAAGPYKE